MFRSETIKGEHGWPWVIPKQAKLTKVEKLDLGKVKEPSSEKFRNKSVTHWLC